MRLFATLILHRPWADLSREERHRAFLLFDGYMLDIAKGGAVGSSVVQFHLADDPLASSDSWSEAPGDPNADPRPSTPR